MNRDFLRILYAVTFAILFSVSVFQTQASEASAGSSRSQISKFKAIDRHALNAPVEVTRSVKTLSAYLVKPAKNDTEKARAIFRWITENITYDVKALKSDKPPLLTPQQVLDRRIAVCQGYSVLFDSLADAAGLKATFINGIVKGYNTIPGSETGRLRHAWNGINLGGKWYLIDCTWGSGYMDDSGKFIKHFEDHYFFTQPSELIYSHFPDDPKWQLLNNPVKKAQFLAYANLKPAFFQHDLQIVSHPNALIKADDNVLIKLRAPEKVSILASIYQNNCELAKTLTLAQPYYDQYLINASFPKGGKYLLRIFVSDNSSGNYDLALEYNVESSYGTGNQKAYPQTFLDFQTRHVILIEPINGVLDSNSTHKFTIVAPGAEKVGIIEDNNATQLKRQSPESSTFSGEVTIGASDIQVGAQYPGNNFYSILLIYTSE